MSEHDPDDELEFSEELEEQWAAEWDQADRDAVEVLREALSQYQGQPPPASELTVAAATVRSRLHEGGGYPLDWVREAAGVSNDPAITDDAELLIQLTAATISPLEETGLDIEEEALLMSLEHADWLGAIVSAVRGGPGAEVSPGALVDGIRDCPEVNTDDGIDFDEASHLEAAFSIIALPWHGLGLSDSEERLTELGQWTLPRALARAWQGSFDDESGGETS